MPANVILALVNTTIDVTIDEEYAKYIHMSQLMPINEDRKIPDHDGRVYRLFLPWAKPS